MTAVTANLAPRILGCASHEKVTVCQLSVVVFRAGSSERSYPVGFTHRTNALRLLPIGSLASTRRRGGHRGTAGAGGSFSTERVGVIAELADSRAVSLRLVERPDR